MAKPNKKKVCIVASSLSKGGAERSSANLSHMLFKLGYNVHIVTVLSGSDYEYSGELFNLGEFKDNDDSLLGRIKRFQLFKRYISKHNFDLIIDNRARVQAYREILISKFLYRIPVVYVIHNYNEKKAFTKYKGLNKWLYKHEYMTVVSEAARKKYIDKFNLEQIRTIYNGFDFDSIKVLANKNVNADLPQSFILFYGRIDDQHKNLKLLLEAYKSSNLIAVNTKLLILGDGPDYDMIMTYAEELDLSDDVLFLGFVKNPYPYVKKAKFTVLTSRYEGFPMVIPESLCLGIPVVSVDCNSGPNEVVQTGFNGILVENHNKNKLSEAFNTFLSDTKLYQKCVSNTVSSVQKFSMTSVMQSWDKLLNDILK